MGKLVRLNSVGRRGFTIVELLIVIVIIGILAAITIVAYNGIQQRASTAAMHSDLAAVTKHMKLARVDSTNEAYPTSLPSGVKASQGVVLQLAQTPNDQSFCVNAYRSSPYAVASFDSSANTIRPYLCAGATIGSAVGGSVPSTPRGVNLATDLSAWTTTGGVSYNTTTKEISFSGSGDMTSPLIRIDEPTSATLQVESYATTSAPSHTPNSGVYFTSYYFGANGSSPATNSIGYTSNGNAQMTPIASWTQRQWNTPAGPGVVYVKFVIRSSPSNYTSDNRIRNVTVVAN